MASNTGPVLSDDGRARLLRLDAWTVRELGCLCIGVDPFGGLSHEQLAAYNDAVDAINRAVRVGVLNEIELRWEPTNPERLYADYPAFSLPEAIDWASERFKGTFPHFDKHDVPEPKEPRSGRRVYALVAFLLRTRSAESRTAAAIARDAVSAGDSWADLLKERTVRDILKEAEEFQSAASPNSPSLRELQSTPDPHKKTSS